MNLITGIPQGSWELSPTFILGGRDYHLGPSWFWLGGLLWLFVYGIPRRWTGVGKKKKKKTGGIELINICWWHIFWTLGIKKFGQNVRHLT